MKKLLLFIFIVVIAGCNTNSEEAIRDKISKKKKEVSVLTEEINTLEKELAEITGKDDVFKVPVLTKELKYESFTHYFEVSGVVEAVNEAFISPEVSGQIKQIYVKEGDYVNKGQLLVQLSSDITESTIEEIQSSLDHAIIVFEKQKRLWDKGIGSEIQYLEAKNAKENLERKLETLDAQLDMSRIKSPVSGIVDEIFHKQGELASPGAQLMQVVNLSELYVNAEVSETYLSSVKVGEQAYLKFPAYPSLDMQVPVSRTGNVINPSSRTFKIQFRINNSQSKLKPNILALVRLNDFSTDNALIVPSKIIKQDIKGKYLYVLKNSDTRQIAHKVYVETGRSYHDKTMVIQGLAPGDKVIVTGYNLVSDGTEVILNG